MTDTPAAPELLPCPFCGAEQDDLGNLDDDAFFCQSSSGTLAIGCSRCMCIGPEGKGRAEAIAAWNTRTVQAQIDAAVNAERERCAKVAETCPDSHWGPWVAAVIRKGDQP